MHRIKIVIFLVQIVIFSIVAQSSFDIQIEPITIAGVGGLQSFAYGQHEGKWLVVGGRLDGLHRRQPFASFDIAGHNTQIYVVDPENNQSWTASLDVLQPSIKEQLSATNLEFYQDGNTLYILGGYGYSATSADHITYPNLTAIDIPNLIFAIQNDQSIKPYIRQIYDENMA